MYRRDLLKGLAATGAIAAVPAFVSANSQQRLPVHFICLGGAGYPMLQYFHSKEPDVHFTYIDTSSRRYEPLKFPYLPIQPIDRYVNGSTAHYLYQRNPVQLTSAIQTLLCQPHHYVLLTEFGGYAGTMGMLACTQYLCSKKASFTAIVRLPLYETSGPKVGAEMLPSFQAFPQFHSVDLEALDAREEYKSMNRYHFSKMIDERCYQLFQQYATQIAG